MQNKVVFMAVQTVHDQLTCKEKGLTYALIPWTASNSHVCVSGWEPFVRDNTMSLPRHWKPYCGQRNHHTATNQKISFLMKDKYRGENYAVHPKNHKAIIVVTPACSLRKRDVGGSWVPVMDPVISKRAAVPAL